MTEFKEGDEVWYFTFPEDGCGGHYVEEIDLRVDKYYGWDEATLFAYKSKKDAI